MSHLADAFRARPALIAYLTVGYPDISATRRLVPLLAEAGCDLVELGIPFSDPLADGATIQKATHHALLNGVTPQQCLDVAGAISRESSIPLAFMTYYNLILSYGVESFCTQSAANGVSGLIIPDLPPDEGGELQEAAKAHNIDVVYLLAPTSTDARIRVVSAAAQGFIYLVSIAGVTGAREDLPAELEGFVGRVRAATSKPLAVGFGVSTPQQAARIARVADGVIVGSKLLQLVEGDDKNFSATSRFVRELRAAIDSSARGRPHSP